jgi:hypothetical protein
LIHLNYVYPTRFLRITGALLTLLSTNEGQTAISEVVGNFCALVAALGPPVATDASRHGFMNVEIFETLHYASMIIVDVTGQHPNCFIELGYGLGTGGRVIVTAKSGTTLPFDQQAIPCFFWSLGDSAENTRRDFQAFIDKHLNRPPLVL